MNSYNYKISSCITSPTPIYPPQYYNMNNSIGMYNNYYTRDNDTQFNEEVQTFYNFITSLHNDNSNDNKYDHYIINRPSHPSPPLYNHTHPHQLSQNLYNDHYDSENEIVIIDSDDEYNESLYASTKMKQLPEWMDQDYFYFDTLKEATKACIDKTIELFNYFFPLNIYYEYLFKNEVKKVGTIHSFNYHGQLGKKKFSFNSTIEEDLIHLINGKPSLNKIGNILRRMEMGKICKYSGWSILKYKTKYGEYKPIGKLLTTQCKRGEALPSVNYKIKYCDTSHNFLLYNMSEKDLPLIE